MMKLNFLNHHKIKNDKAVSQELMQMLMPKVIVERISNFELTSKGCRNDHRKLLD